VTNRGFWSVVALSLLSFTGAAHAAPVKLADIRQNLFSTCTHPDGQRWIVGELGRVYSTKDNGKTFDRSPIETREAFLAVACPTDGALIIGGQYGRAIRSRDRGQTWQKLETGSDQNILDMAFPTPQLGIAVGDYGTILRTTDGGDSWTRIPLPTDIPLPEDIAEIIEPGDVLLYGIAFTDPDHGWIAGEFGVILATVDGGQTWVAQPSNVETTLFGISFADNQRGWAVGIEEVLLHTTDGGATWNPQSIPLRPGFVLALYNVQVNGNIGWAVGDSGLLLRTTDAGESWERVNLPIALAANWLRDIDLNQTGDGLIIGGSGLLIVTHGEEYDRLGQ